MGRLSEAFDFVNRRYKPKPYDMRFMYHHIDVEGEDNYLDKTRKKVNKLRKLNDINTCIKDVE